MLNKDLKSYKELDEVKDETVKVCLDLQMHKYKYKPMVVKEGILFPIVYWDGIAGNKAFYLLVDKDVIKEAIDSFKELDNGR